MWIFLNDAFLSVVQPDPAFVPANMIGQDVLMVRARRKIDLMNTFGKGTRIIETPDRDYRWRVYVKRQNFAALIHENVLNINYDNFKDSIDPKDKQRKTAYMSVWACMDRFQALSTPRHRSAPLFDDDAY